MLMPKADILNITQAHKLLVRFYIGILMRLCKHFSAHVKKALFSDFAW